jgi:hypothetical protein
MTSIDETGDVSFGFEQLELWKKVREFKKEARAEPGYFLRKKNTIQHRDFIYFKCS